MTQLRERDTMQPRILTACATLILMLPVNAPSAAAAAGDLDTSFGGDGKVLTWSAEADSALASGVAIQADGKIVAAGRAEGPRVGQAFALARYNTDGTLDATFGGDGKVLTPGGTASALAIQADGKIVVGGSSVGAGFALFRHRRDGSLGENFGRDGEVSTSFPDGEASLKAVAIQADGRIVAAGDVSNGTEGRFALARFGTGGNLDDTFGSDGRVTTRFGGGFATAFALAIQADGRIVAAGAREKGTGRRFALARYHAS
jgi:uncharacterized delta-60 repeat protein